MAEGSPRGEIPLVHASPVPRVFPLDDGKTRRLVLRDLVATDYHVVHFVRTVGEA